MNHEHTASDSEYDVTLDTAFASSCTVTDLASGSTRTVYRQDPKQPVDVRPQGHPKRHRIVLKGKNGRRRNVTITIDDPEHALHGLKVDLYREGRDPASRDREDATESFTILNHALTCPPFCGG
jgi:hypothetical protein